MNVNQKTSNFLLAIDRYGESERYKINQEVEDLKTKELYDAEKVGKRDKEQIIRNELQQSLSKTITEYALKEQDLRKSLFMRRQEMVKEIRDSVISKLTDFRKSESYKEYLAKASKEVVDYLKDNEIIIYLSEEDNTYQSLIKEYISNATFEVDKLNTLGGFKAYSKKESILIDETLETKLDDEIKNFVSGSNLKVV